MVGMAGAIGEEGEGGTTGLKGEFGTSGQNGDPGQPGFQGDKGRAGLNGSKGRQVCMISWKHLYDYVSMQASVLPMLETDFYVEI